MFSLSKEKTWIKLALLLMLVVTLAISLFAIFKYGNYFLLGSMDKMDNDDVKYVRSAITLLEKGMFTYHDVNTPTVFIMPGHPVLLAGIMQIFGTGDSGITAFRVFQALLQACCLYLIFLIGREVFNSKVALLACLIDALYIPEISNVGVILTEIEFKTLLLLMVYVSLYALKTRQTKYYFWGGVIWGLTCLFRPTIAAYPGVILIMWFVHKYSFKEMLKYTLVVVGVFVVIMSPWWVRNYLDFNRVILLTLSSGNPFLQGTYINYDQTRDYVPYTPDPDAIKNDKIEMDTGKYRLMTYGKQHPLEYIKWYTLGKSKYLWITPFYWKQVFDISIKSVVIYNYVILLTAIAGALFMFRKKLYGGIFLFSTLAYFNVMHLPYFTFSRYVYPVMPLVMLFSAYGLISISGGLYGLIRFGLPKGKQLPSIKV
jgi:hypothetical protein